MKSQGMGEKRWTPYKGSENRIQKGNRNCFLCMRITVKPTSLLCCQFPIGTNRYLRFQVLTAAGTKMTVFWDVTPCSLIEIFRRFRGSYLPDYGGSKHIWNVIRFLRATRRNIPEDSHPHDWNKFQNLQFSWETFSSCKSINKQDCCVDGSCVVGWIITQQDVSDHDCSLLVCIIVGK
jgi:hypothetical protein